MKVPIRVKGKKKMKKNVPQPLKRNAKLKFMQDLKKNLKEKRN